MATGYSGIRDRNHGSSSSNYRSDSPDDRFPSRSNNYPKHTNKNSYNEQDSAHLNDMTLAVVNDFKRSVQKKAQDGTKMSEPMVESEVTNIRRNKYPDECNFNEWKENLPYDVKDCPDTILRVSMAYGNDPHEVKSILQTKMNNTNSNVNSTDPSLNNIIGPLRRLKENLDSNRKPNLFRAVRNIDDRDINRANRLFLSEVHHFAPDLEGYTFDDAQNAVQAIREKNYESNESKDLLPIIKVCKGVDEIRDYLDSITKPPTKKDESPKKTSRFPSTDRTTSNSIINSPNRNNTNQIQTFYHGPLSDPYKNSPQPSAQFDSRSRDETTRGSLRRNSERR